jgi:hypothetical protein
MNENQRGLLDEKVVIEWLKELGHDVQKALTAKEQVNGIDAYVDGQPVDIKSQKYFPSSSISFELEVFSARDKAWHRSWFYNGDAPYYYFLYDNNVDFLLILVNKFLIKDFNRITQLKQETIKRQIAEGRDHVDAKIGILSIEKGIKDGCFTIVSRKSPEEIAIKRLECSRAATTSHPKPKVKSKVSDVNGRMGTTVCVDEETTNSLLQNKATQRPTKRGQTYRPDLSIRKVY